MADICRRLTAAWLALFLVAAGCSSPDLESLQPGSTILAFGDSLTYGVGASSANSYPAVLAELSGLEVINAGVSGETTDKGRIRLGQVLEKSVPDLLILLEGGNDILRNRSPAKTKADLAAMIEMAVDRGIPVVLIGVPQKKIFSNAAPLYAELADEHPVIYDGTLLGSLLRSPSYKSDPIHLNDKGYQKMAESIYALLADNFAFD